MDKQRILMEAQKIASKFSFWMVSGNIAHLYGYVFETPDKKYELEIKFDENFPTSPPQFIFHSAIKNILNDFQLRKLSIWTPESAVVDIIKELNVKIQEKLRNYANNEGFFQPSEENIEPIDPEEYIIPDLDVYPSDIEYNIDKSQISSENLFYTESTEQRSFNDETYKVENLEITPNEENKKGIEGSELLSIGISTELGLIQQFYAYDQKGINPADINIYMTITIVKTFIIGINFIEYP
ncbi:MAG: ubiquitin-conjugating enzyme E2 variant, partial [Promethearchaeota archaeon]